MKPEIISLSLNSEYSLNIKNLALCLYSVDNKLQACNKKYIMSTFKKDENYDYYMQKAYMIMQENIRLNKGVNYEN